VAGCDKIVREQVSSVAERQQLEAALDYVREAWTRWTITAATSLPNADSRAVATDPVRAVHLEHSDHPTHAPGQGGQPGQRGHRPWCR
jgi:hypothetical protein